jgi:hypothetical protein
MKTEKKLTVGACWYNHSAWFDCSLTVPASLFDRFGIALQPLVNRSGTVLEPLNDDFASCN